MDFDPICQNGSEGDQRQTVTTFNEKCGGNDSLSLATKADWSPWNSAASREFCWFPPSFWELNVQSTRVTINVNFCSITMVVHFSCCCFCLCGMQMRRGWEDAACCRNACSEEEYDQTVIRSPDQVWRKPECAKKPAGMTQHAYKGSNRDPVIVLKNIFTNQRYHGPSAALMLNSESSRTPVKLQWQSTLPTLPPAVHVYIAAAWTTHFPLYSDCKTSLRCCTSCCSRFHSLSLTSR